MTNRFDIAIVGAGVVGSAVARDLSRYDLSVALLEANPDFGDESSKGNSALMSRGIDTPIDTLEHALVRRGYARYLSEAPAMGLPIRMVGAVTLAWTEEQSDTLGEEFERIRAAGGDDHELLQPDEVYRRWPNFGAGLKRAIWSPREAIADPFSTPYAYVLDAVMNGADYRFSWKVVGAERLNRGWRITSSGGERIEAGFVINAGGLRADIVEGLGGYADFELRPRRGQYIVLDKAARQIHDVIALPTPTPTSRGILITPTIFGNVIIGPTAEDVDDRDDRRTTADGLAELCAAMRRTVPALASVPVNTMFAGMRPGTNHSDYQIIQRFADDWLTVAGIRSTGFSGALGIAEYVRDLLIPAVFEPAKKADVQDVSVPDLAETSPRPWQEPQRIASDGTAAEMVCHCERITLAEVKAALSSPVPPRTLKALKRRTRVMFGRCQGFYCGARIQCLFDEAAARR